MPTSVYLRDVGDLCVGISDVPDIPDVDADVIASDHAAKLKEIEDRCLEQAEAQHAIEIEEEKQKKIEAEVRASAERDNALEEEAARQHKEKMQNIEIQVQVEKERQIRVEKTRRKQERELREAEEMLNEMKKGTSRMKRKRPEISTTTPVRPTGKFVGESDLAERLGRLSNLDTTEHIEKVQSRFNAREKKRSEATDDIPAFLRAAPMKPDDRSVGGISKKKKKVDDEKKTFAERLESEKQLLNESLNKVRGGPDNCVTQTLDGFAADRDGCPTDEDTSPFGRNAGRGGVTPSTYKWGWPASAEDIYVSHCIKKYKWRDGECLKKLRFEGEDIQWQGWQSGEGQKVWVDDPTLCICGKSCLPLECPTLIELGAVRAACYGSCERPLPVGHGPAARVCAQKAGWGDKSRIQRQITIDFMVKLCLHVCALT